ncbi:MAG: bifunctional tetrahydrofolate synthase/dihydrofolate synthase [Proteobacteria bacterium]|nr:bifunctional tetrahydrofolate synthase/dihydrofolate synthase [Pseudomonadota bacterium]
MRFDTLEAWLAWQESLNPRGIELGLERVCRVLARLEFAHSPFRVITVGGTNGKGSVATVAASILQAAGHRTGRYLSPHILSYNERIAIDGEPVSDDALCAAFEIVDQARGEEALTYFEFGTLAAFEVFRKRKVDVAVLEVGLGGRLDAVNVLDPDVAVVVSVGLDHTDWLGNDIDTIAREKAGIFRQGRPAIFGSANVPEGIVAAANEIGAKLVPFGQAFDYEPSSGKWTWRSRDRIVRELPNPPLAGIHQFANAATAIAAVLALEPTLPDEAIRKGVLESRLAGRLQSLGGTPEVILDVGHNPDAAARVAAFLHDDPRPTIAVLAMLADKDAAGLVRELAPHVQQWHLAPLQGARGQSAEALASRLQNVETTLKTTTHGNVAEAAVAALQSAPESGRVLVTGSFHTVAEFLVYFEAKPGTNGMQVG